MYRFELLGTRILIDRLLRRNLHEFATLVTKLLRMPPEEGANRILVQWAVQEVSFQRYICSRIEAVYTLRVLNSFCGLQIVPVSHGMCLRDFRPHRKGESVNLEPPMLS